MTLRPWFVREPSVSAGLAPEHDDARLLVFDDAVRLLARDAHQPGRCASLPRHRVQVMASFRLPADHLSDFVQNDGTPVHPMQCSVDIVVDAHTLSARVAPFF